ncbi:MAG: SPOR domain-containing protein [Treponema sp.]|nr:SPOR domain-containing protein [Treponema sp.]
MEQKRTLWIIAATGIFLLVVIGAALILYSPSMQTRTVKPASFDSNIGWISTPKVGDEATNPTASALADASTTTDAAQSSDTSSALTAPDNSSAVAVAKVSSTDNASIQQNPFESPIKADHITVVTDNTTVYSTDTKTVDLQGLHAAMSNVSAKNEYTESKISKNSAKSQDSASAPQTTKKVAQAPAAKTTQPASTSKSTASAKPKSTAPSTKSQSVAKSSSTSQDKFWVQAAAYSSKKNADEARSVLESNKIPTEVFTVDANGTMMYRVRVGPYTTKTEAEYWQKEIAKIEKFADTKSQIFNTKVN